MDEMQVEVVLGFAVFGIKVLQKNTPKKKHLTAGTLKVPGLEDDFPF